MCRFRIFLLTITIFSFPLLYGKLIDLRFPDYIVDPLVPCKSEGYFEHPRNCSWFYRCFTVENLTDFYRRDYFECAPGTVFSSEHGLCDFGSWETCNQASNCDACDVAKVDAEGSSCAHFDLCPNINDKSTKVSIELCQNATYGCENCTNLSPCLDGEWLVISPKQKHFIRNENTLPIQCHKSPYSPELQCPVTIPAESCNTCSVSTSNCQDYTVCPDGVSKINLTLCSMAQRVCESCPAHTLCSDGQYFDMLEQVCYPSPDSTALQCISPDPAVPGSNCVNCTVAASSCYPMVVCPNGGSAVSKTVCGVALNVCPNCEVSTRVCPEQHYYIPEDQACQTYPFSSDWLCPSVPHPASIDTTTPDMTSSTESTILTPTEPPCNDCYISAVRCAPVDVCPSGGPKVTMSLCRNATKICHPCGSQDSVCPAGLFYSMESTACFPNPASSSMQCIEKGKRGSTLRNQDGTLNKPSEIECSAKNRLPKQRWIKEKFCKKYEPCFQGSGQFTGIVELCTSFYQCILDAFDNTWKVIESQCGGEKLFSYEAESCISEPKNICRVY